MKDQSKNQVDRKTSIEKVAGKLLPFKKVTKLQKLKSLLRNINPEQKETIKTLASLGSLGGLTYLATRDKTNKQEHPYVNNTLSGGLAGGLAGGTYLPSRGLLSPVGMAVGAGLGAASGTSEKAQDTLNALVGIGLGAQLGKYGIGTIKDVMQHIPLKNKAGQPKSLLAAKGLLGLLTTALGAGSISSGINAAHTRLNKNYEKTASEGTYDGAVNGMLYGGLLGGYSNPSPRAKFNPALGLAGAGLGAFASNPDNVRTRDSLSGMIGLGAGTGVTLGSIAELGNVINTAPKEIIKNKKLQTALGALGLLIGPAMISTGLKATKRLVNNDYEKKANYEESLGQQGVFGRLAANMKPAKETVQKNTKNQIEDIHDQSLEQEANYYNEEGVNTKVAGLRDSAMKVMSGKAHKNKIQNILADRALIRDIRKVTDKNKGKSDDFLAPGWEKPKKDLPETPIDYEFQNYKG